MGVYNGCKKRSNLYTLTHTTHEKLDKVLFSCQISDVVQSQENHVLENKQHTRNVNKTI